MKAVFRDFDEFADSIQGIAGRFVPTARSEADWWIHVEPVGALSVQQLQIGGAATYAGDGTPDTLTFGIPTTTPGRIRIDGQMLDENSFIVLRRDQPFTFAARETTRWMGITIPVDHCSMPPSLHAAACESFEHYRETRARTELRHLNRLRSLAVRVCCVDGTVGFADAVATRAAEQEMLSWASRMLESSQDERSTSLGRPLLSRARVIARALALINANAGKPLFIDDLCRATEVSERTLRKVFHEYFEVGPMRLLKMRQLTEVRAALLAADPATDTVTRIAARFGIWDFSLFASNYKSLFAETPSATLRRPATSPARRQEAPWMRFISQKFPLAGC